MVYQKIINRIFDILKFGSNILPLYNKPGAWDFMFITVDNQQSIKFVQVVTSHV